MRPNPVEGNLYRDLLLGAKFFKGCLVILGLYIIVDISVVKRLNYDSNTEGVKATGDGYALIALGFILFAAFLLRLYKLDVGPWFDEIATYVNYSNMPFGKLITTYDSQNNHILYTIFAHASERIFGEGVWALRLPAVIFGVGSLLLLYVFAREVTDIREALLSTLLLSFSYHHIWFSQNARGYSGLLFWTLLSSWFFIRGFRRDSPFIWTGYAIAIALGAYTHMTMFFVIIAHFFIYMMVCVNNRDRSNRWLGFYFGFCLGGILTLTLYSFVMPQILGGTMWEGAKKTITAWRNPLWMLTEIATAMKISFVSGVAALMALLILGIGVFSYIRSEPIVIMLLFLPLIIGFALIVLLGHPLFPRLFFFTIGFGIVVVVRGVILSGTMIGSAIGLNRDRSILLGTGFSLILFFLFLITLPRVYLPKQDYLGALRFVQEEERPGDVVLTLGITSTFPYRYFYKAGWETVDTLERLSRVRSRSKRTWIVYTLPRHLKAVYPDLMSVIENDCKVVKRFYGTLGGGTIFVCRFDNAVAKREEMKGL